MEVGFFFWPYSPDLVRRMAKAADRYGFDLIGIADTPGNAMDPWVAATMVAAATERARLAICVSNLASRHPAVSAAAIASNCRYAPPCYISERELTVARNSPRQKRQS